MNENTVKRIDHTLRDHAELSGSSAERWLHCSGSILLSRSVNKRDPGPAAIEGSRLHELAEKQLGEMLSYYREGTKPKGLTDLDEYDYNIQPEEPIETVVREVYEKVLENQLTGKIIGLELEVSVDDRFKMYGHTDLWAVYRDNYGKRVGVIVDYKFGYHAVDVEKNAQLAFYAVGLLNYIRSKGKDLDYIRTIIIQPKTDPHYKEAKLTAKTLEIWQKKFQLAAKKIYVDKNFTYKVGKWCEFCPGKVLCKAYLKDTETKSALNLVNLNEVVFEEPETLSIDVIENIILHADRLEDFLARCREYLISKLRSGYDSAQLKLVEGRPKRKWKEDEKQVASRLLSFGLQKKDIYELALRGIGKIEPALVKLEKPKYKGKKAKEIKEIVKETLMSEVTEMGKAGYNLVPISDDRPAVRNALSLFSNEESVEAYDELATVPF